MLRLVSKKQMYFIQKSAEPNEMGSYIVIYKSKTPQGYGEGRVYKGTLKKCKKYIKTMKEGKNYGI